MKKRILILVALTAALVSLGGGGAGAASGPTTIYYGDITVDGGFHWMLGSWDLTAGPVIVSYELDLTQAPNNACNYWNTWSTNPDPLCQTVNHWSAANVGLVWPGSPWAGAWMGGFLSDGDNPNGLVMFPMFPDNDGSQDLDDKFNMARSPNPGYYDERYYGVDCTSKAVQPEVGVPTAWSNYGIWFDRDGVDQWQATMWGMVNGGTYNTGGVYHVQIKYEKASNYLTSKGTACAMLFPNLTNSDAPGGYGIPTGFGALAGGGYQYFPYGISFDTDEARMADMRVFVSGDVYPGGMIVVRNLTVTGYLNLEEGTATGGGWFIPEAGSAINITPGGKATFGFVAKQDDKKGSSGHLEFQYHADNLNLKSTSYDWVTLSNTQVIFEGVGTLNGEPDYKFRVWAFDGDKAGGQPDRFTIRIWTGGGSFESQTYRAEGDLGGGQIVVHKK